MNFPPSPACVCAQSCPTPRDPTDRGPPGSSVHGISRAGVPEWVAISYSRGIFLMKPASLALAGKFFSLSLYSVGADLYV